MSERADQRNDQRETAERLVDWPITAVVWALCLGYSFHQAPLPGVNEPHYLSMARSFVDPGWCARDPFLQSHPVHWAFFTLVGWPTYWWGFEIAAICGRVLGYGALAVGWTALVRQLTGSTLGPIWVLAGTLTGMTLGNFSGEWLIGGIEGKVFAYAAVFGAMACLMRRETALAALWTGIAIAFHPVVGLWHLLAAGGTLALMRFGPRGGNEEPGGLNQRPRTRFLYGGIALVFGLVGFLPAAALLVSVPEEVAYRGTEIQVYQRLAHHLNPLKFSVDAYRWYGGLTAAACVLWFLVPRTRAWRFCRLYVWWCVFFAVAGVIVGYFPRWFPGSSLDHLSPRLLKFYPFRMGDILLPWFVITAVPAAITMSSGRVAARRGYYELVLTVGLCGVLAGVVGPYRNQWYPVTLSEREATDWLKMCQWVRLNAGEDALVLTTRRGWGFKWYAERAEYFSHKDAPQDAPGLIAWEGRQRLLWELFSERFGREDLIRFRKETGTDYAVLARGTPCDLSPTYENGSFALYDLRPLGGGSR